MLVRLLRQPETRLPSLDRHRASTARAKPIITSSVDHSQSPIALGARPFSPIALAPRVVVVSPPPLRRRNSRRISSAARPLPRIARSRRPRRVIFAHLTSRSLPSRLSAAFPARATLERAFSRAGQNAQFSATRSISPLPSPRPPSILRARATRRFTHLRFSRPFAFASTLSLATARGVSE